MRTTRLLRTALLSLAAMSTFSITGHAAQPADSPTRADQLFNQAVSLEQRASAAFPRHMRQAARLYLKSAELRGDSDPLKIESLYRAGGLLMTLQPQRAHRLVAEAAELALFHGDPLRAAHLYLDGAWVVAAHKSAAPDDLQLAKEYIEKAHLLADAAKLSTEERGSILKRIRNPAPEMAAAR